jgi:RND family efflux transporter MFP subunit
VSTAWTVLRRATATLGFAALAATAVVLGVGHLTDRAAAVPEPEAAAALPVRVETVRFAEGFVQARRFVGQIEAQSTLSLSFELGGRLEALLVQEGEPVVAGQELARLDTDLLEAEADRLAATRAAAVAQRVYAEARLGRARALQQEGYSSRETLDQALAARDELTNRIAETDAALRAIEINLRKSVLLAPVTGRIAAQTAEAAETVQAGHQIVSVLDTTRPEVRIGLPLEIGAQDLQDVMIEVGGRPLPATLKRLRADIDPVTRTRTALFDLAAPAGEVVFGQTATLVLERFVPAEGMWLPLDALQSGKGSVWTVMVVADDRLRRATVELLHPEGERAFVQGTLRPGDRVVRSGAHRVVAGQRVRALDAEG